MKVGGVGERRRPKSGQERGRGDGASRTSVQRSSARRRDIPDVAGAVRWGEGSRRHARRLDHFPLPTSSGVLRSTTNETGPMSPMSATRRVRGDMSLLDRSPSTERLVDVDSQAPRITRAREQGPVERINVAYVRGPRYGSTSSTAPSFRTECIIGSWRQGRPGPRVVLPRHAVPLAETLWYVERVKSATTLNLTVM